MAEVSDILTAKGVHTIKELVATTAMIKSVNPMWKPEDNPQARALSELFQVHLWSRRDAIIDQDIKQATRRSEADGDEGSCSKIGARKKHKKGRGKKRDKSSSSSNGSSSSADVTHKKDANKIISKSKFKVYGLDLLPEPKLILQVHNKNKHLLEEGAQFVSSVPLEERIPS